MPDPTNSTKNYADRIARTADVERSAWEQTLNQLDKLAADLRDEGWEVTAVAAGHLAPEPDDVGEEGRYGFVYSLSDNDADAVADALDADFAPTRVAVFQRDVDQRRFVLVKICDPNTQSTILMAGSCERRHLIGLVKTGMERGDMYTHIQRLNGTVIASFHHDGYEQFFPQPEFYVDDD